MEENRKERLVLSITTLAGISCMLQNHFGGWEFWMPPLVLLGAVLTWWIHITQRYTDHFRYRVYFGYSAFLLFYHGAHDTSLFDLSVSALLFLAAFMAVDSVRLLNLILAEYAVVMVMQFVFLYRNDALDMDAFTRMRIVYHAGTVIVMYVFSRLTVIRRMAERDRIEAWRKTVDENNNDMEDFLSNVSHELRTPVNVISGMTTLLQKESNNDKLETIRNAGIRLSHQIEDIQDYTELKRDELALEEDNYMCTSLINDVVAYYNMNNRRQDIELIVDLDPETPSMLKGDIKKLHKLFRHLLDNALKFTKRGGVYVRVHSNPQEYGVNLTIEVTDTGIGMSRAAMAQITKGMYQANKKRNRSTGGIGIGLPIVYGIVHRMGGFVRIDSKRGKGTTVHLSIPQQVVDPSPCLSVTRDLHKDIVFYIKPEKYKVPEMRDFNQSMAINLSRGLKKRLYYASDKRELEHLLDDREIGFIYTGQEEYEAESAMLDYLSSKGIRIVVYTNDGMKATPGSGVVMMSKPLYGFPVVRFLNGETDITSSPEEGEGRPSFARVRALIVDDEPMNLVVASGLFRDYQMITDTAESGKDAIEKYSNGTYDIIFMDHMMPEMDGVEAMKRIRQVAAARSRHPLFIALTANALSGAKEMFLREGFDGFIAKPIDIMEFERVMRRVLPEELIQYEGRDAQ